MLKCFRIGFRFRGNIRIESSKTLREIETIFGFTVLHSKRGQQSCDTVLCRIFVDCFQTNKFLKKRKRVYNERLYNEKKVTVPVLRFFLKGVLNGT